MIHRPDKLSKENPQRLVRRPALDEAQRGVEHQLIFQFEVVRVLVILIERIVVAESNGRHDTVRDPGSRD